MIKKEEKYIHRIIAQKEGITITAETTVMNLEEAKKTAVAEVLCDVNKAVDFQPFVVLPIATQERWDDKCINFCPRCGNSLMDYELEQHESFDCDRCETSMEIKIFD